MPSTMAELAQAEYARAVRGAPVTPGEPPDVDWFILGMGHSARAAMRWVHKKSAAVGRSYLAGKFARFFGQGGGAAGTARSLTQCLERYIRWDVQAGSWGSAVRFDLPETVDFGSGQVRAIGNMVRVDGTEARMILCDDLPIDVRMAEMLALPIFECVDAHFGSGTADVIHVWQLGTDQRVAVRRAAAEARRGEVQALLAQF
jgi:hypothetical protein